MPASITEIEWIKKDIRKEYRLFQGDKDIGYLKWRRIFRSYAIGELKGETYTFLLKGFFNKTLIIQAADTRKKLGIIRKVRYKKNIILLYNGRKYSWKYMNFLRTKSGWFSLESNEPFIAYTNPFFYFRDHGKIQYEFLTEEENLLILAGLFLRLIRINVYL
ncbi:MAG: hypothetical protein Q8910_07420 [Bacteroidota bacterium]|nr:hypothetical protein [Bacteroidota bacterium]MDP4226192.1 hypothetical protein [Bacteroidota bacterium]